MPKLWNETVQEHRRTVRNTILDSLAALMAEHGLTSLKMSQVAERAGIGRATLYKYFPDVEAVMFAWHERLVNEHFEQLVTLGDKKGSVRERLQAVLTAFALISFEHPSTQLSSLLHQGAHIHHTQEKLHAYVSDLLHKGIQGGEVRDDASPDELATYCLHALTAASSLPSKAAVERLVRITLSGLRARS